MPKKDQDKTVLLLIDKVSEKKKQIQSAQNPQWQTNCLLTVDGSNVNLRTIQTAKELVLLAAKVKIQEMGYNAAIDELGGSADFEYQGYSTDQWMSDFYTRLNKLNVDKEKRNLAKLEQRLDAIISPELRAKMELEAIERELED